MAPAPKKPKAKASVSGGVAGRGKRKAPESTPQQNLSKWFAPMQTRSAGDTLETRQPSANTSAALATESPPVLDEPPVRPADVALALEGAASTTQQGIYAERQGFADAWSNNKFGRVVRNWLVEHDGLYWARLKGLRQPVARRAKELWGKELGSDRVLIGVLFKHMKARPNLPVLYRDALSVAGGLPKKVAMASHSLCSDADELWLENGEIRVKLDMASSSIAKVVTGLVVAVRGTVTNKGLFEVQDWCTAETPPPPPIVPNRSADGNGPPYLALLSGLGVGAGEDTARARDRAVGFLLGNSGDKRLAALGRKVQRLVIGGGLLAKDTFPAGAKAISVRAALDEADALLARLSAVMPVDLMPGMHDPTNLGLPQQPLHPYLFRRVRECRNFRSVSNPFECSLAGGLRLLGHSGQPVQDLLRCARLASPLEALHLCLRALHLAPTAPDTLVAQPSAKSDPFVLDAVPHVLFSGGHEKESHAWEIGTMCVCIPAFYLCPKIVLVNLTEPQEVQVVDFSMDEKDKT